MSKIRHFTASAVVFNDQDQVLLIFHNRVGCWLYPGGHIDANEDPAQAAVREVREETGIDTTIVGAAPVAGTNVVAHPAPWTILEMPVEDAKVGAHHHIDLVYVLRAAGGELTAQLSEVAAARWVPVGEVTDLDTPPELPAVILAAYGWMRAQQVSVHV